MCVCGAGQQRQQQQSQRGPRVCLTHLWPQIGSCVEGAQELFQRGRRRRPATYSREEREMEMVEVFQKQKHPSSQRNHWTATKSLGTFTTSQRRTLRPLAGQRPSAVGPASGYCTHARARGALAASACPPGDCLPCPFGRKRTPVLGSPGSLKVARDLAISDGTAQVPVLLHSLASSCSLCLCSRGARAHRLRQPLQGNPRQKSNETRGPTVARRLFHLDAIRPMC